MKSKIKMDNVHKISTDIVDVLSLSIYQQKLRNKSVEELRYITRHAFDQDTLLILIML